MRKLASLVLILLLAAVVCAYVLRELWREEPGAGVAPVPPAGEAGQPQGTAPVRAPAPRADIAPTAGATGSVAPPGLEQRLHAARDYLEFARSIHEAAKRGDAESQYYLYRVLDYCHKHFRLYFGRPERPRTLDEGLRWAANNSPALDPEEGRLVHERCRAMVDPAITEFGESLSWLRMSAQAGQPRAQVALASRRTLDAARSTEGSAEAAAAMQDAKRLVLEALASRDPEAIYDAGLLQHLRTGMIDLDWAAWQIAACRRGVDCGPSAERTRQACRFYPNCQPYETLPDMLRRYTADVPSLDARAAEINRLIDAGDWPALGFASPPESP